MTNLPESGAPGIENQQRLGSAHLIFGMPEGLTAFISKGVAGHGILPSFDRVKHMLTLPHRAAVIVALVERSKKTRQDMVISYHGSRYDSGNRTWIEVRSGGIVTFKLDKMHPHGIIGMDGGMSRRLNPYKKNSVTLGKLTISFSASSYPTQPRTSNWQMDRHL